MIIKLLTEGGAMKPGPALSQKLGPAGINIGQVISKVNDSTKQFSGMKVPVELEINTSTKEIKVFVLSPPTSELLKKEFALEKASGDHKNMTVANASIEQIISIAKTKHSNMLAKDLKSAVKMVVGSCVSLGIFVENKKAKEIEGEIDNGIYDKEITEISTQTSQEKRKQLDAYLSNIKDLQEKAAKQAAAAKEAEAATKASAEAGTAQAAAPAEGAKPEEATAGKPATQSKTPAKEETKKGKK